MPGNISRDKTTFLSPLLVIRKKLCYNTSEV